MTLSDATFDAKNEILSRNNDDLLAKVTEFERNDIKIGAKIFLNQPFTEFLHEAIESLFKILQIDRLDNLILVYHPVKPSDELNGKTNGTIESATKLSNGHSNKSSLASSLPKETVSTWGGNENAVHNLKELWQALESYADDKRVCQLGIADLDTDHLIDLYQSCRIKPTIAQINLSACCVVPPPMQEFCTAKEIQLLTHSDSEGKGVVRIILSFIFNEFISRNDLIFLIFLHPQLLYQNKHSTNWKVTYFNHSHRFGHQDTKCTLNAEGSLPPKGSQLALNVIKYRLTKLETISL